MREGFIFDDLSRVKSIPVWGYGTEKNLGLFITKIGAEIRRELKDGVYEERRGSERLKHVIFFIGLPVSGKTWSLGKSELLLRQWTIDLAPLKFSTVSLEGAEDEARQKGRISTPPDLPYSTEELEETSEELKTMIGRSIKESDVVLVEAPVIPDAMVYGERIGRQLGLTVLDQLARRDGVFEDLPSYHLSVVGLVGGSRLSRIMTHFRDSMKNAKNLKEARRVADLFGKQPIETAEDWERTKKEGASFEQIERIRVHLLAVFTELYTRGKISLRHIHGRVGIEGSVLKYIVVENLNLPREDSFIGYNNPSYQDLNIVEGESLEEYLVARTLQKLFPRRSRFLFFDHVAKAADRVKKLFIVP